MKNVISKRNMDYKERYFNAVTSLLLCTLDIQDASTKLAVAVFAFVSSINHALPKNERRNSAVKPFFSNVILKDEAAIVKLVVLLADTLPLFHTTFENLEHVGGITRQIVILRNSVGMLLSKGADFDFFASTLCKSIYLYERTIRISHGDRHHFDVLHAFEHIDVYIYLFNTLGHNKQNSRVNLAFFAATLGVILPCLLFHIYNYQISRTYQQNIPKWFDSSQLPLLETKIARNYNSRRVYAYLTKIYSPALNWNVQSWAVIQHQLKVIAAKIKKSKFRPELCLGVQTGGALCIQYLANHLQCDTVDYLKCKTWSGNTFAEDWTHALNMTVSYDNYLNDAKSCNVSWANKQCSFEHYNSILLFDDTISTGKTICATKAYLLTINPKVVIKTATIFIPRTCNKRVNGLADYYYAAGTVPVFWPWGCELD